MVDNYGRPKSQYYDKLKAMSDGELERESYDMIYHSARCGNNPRSDYHWMVDACYSECLLRGKDRGIYEKAYKQCYADHTS